VRGVKTEQRQRIRTTKTL